MPGVLRGVLYPRAGRSARRASIALNQNTIKYYQIWLRPPGPTEHSVDCGGQAHIGAFCTTFIEIRFSHLSRFPPSHSKQLTSWNITVFSFPPPFITSLCHHLPLRRPTTAPSRTNNNFSLAPKTWSERSTRTCARLFQAPPCVRMRI